MPRTQWYKWRKGSERTYRHNYRHKEGYHAELPYIFSGAFTPNIFDPCFRTIATASQRARRALVNSSSSVMTLYRW
jgi:hypothetical protein